MNIDVQHLAKLARLHLDDKEIEKFGRDMENIVAMVEGLPDTSGDASGLDPEHPMKLREDVISTEKITREELLSNAPKMQAGCVVVPKTVE